MTRLQSAVLLAIAALSGRAFAAGPYSAGNVDGVLTWELGTLQPGDSTRHVVLLAFDDTYEALTKRLEEVRGRLRDARPEADASAVPAESGKVWITNGVTDFALEGTGYFRWRMERQALACERGGQLSQFTWYVHYRAGGEEQRAGTPHIGDSAPENLRIVQPVGAVSEGQALVVLETSDGRLRIRIEATALEGSSVAVGFLLTSTSDEPLDDLRVSCYANLEAAHDHENDISLLDAESAALLVVDPPSGMCAAMADLRRPDRGYSGVWNSLLKLQAAEGIPFDEWQRYSELPADIEQRLLRERMASEGIYLPFSYENPTTPETRTLTPAEAQAAIERDWLFQAEAKPLLERAREEIGWTLSLAARLVADRRSRGLRDDLAELRRLQREITVAARSGGEEARARDLYFAVRRCKRRIMFSDPVIDFAGLLFIDQPTPQGPVNPEHEAIHRMGITAVPGGRLLVLGDLNPGAPVRQLAPEKPGSFWRPDLSFDGERVLYCYKPHDDKSFHLYEVRLDGTGLRQLTFSDYDDTDPMYLPDGHILFTTTRGNSYVRCGPFIYSYTLARCDADGSNVYLISHNGEPDFVPSLMEDGRVIYSRWEYTDRPLWRLQSLWTTHPDGANVQAFWGNRSVWPDHLSEPRQIPGSQRVMFSGVGHHDWWSGSIGIIDPLRGSDYPHGLTKVTADLRWPECSLPPDDSPEAADYHSSGAYTGYKTPYPLSGEEFLVSARGADGKFRLYLMDVHGNRELIYEGAHNILHAIPIKPRRAPPELPGTVIWPGTGERRRKPEVGVLYSTDVYEGVPELPRGIARYVRVWQQDHKTYSTWRKTYRHSGPPVSIVQEESVKRIVSVVPVEADGSVHFTAPPGKSLYFQLLDRDFRCLQTMRSFTGVMPGEQRGCVGCHERHSRTPATRGGLAVEREPTPLSPPPWGTESISYERFAQPVLDRYCGRCHQGDGKARATLDLTLRPGHSVFKEPYLTLVGGAGWGNPVPAQGQPRYGIAGALPVESIDPTMNDPRAYDPIPPMTALSYTSPLIQRASSGEHHGVKADPASLRRLIAWVDACCPFMGEPELRALGDPDFPGIDMLPIRPRVATAPVIERP